MENTFSINSWQFQDMLCYASQKVNMKLIAKLSEQILTVMIVGLMASEDFTALQQCSRSTKISWYQTFCQLDENNSCHLTNVDGNNAFVS